MAQTLEQLIEFISTTETPKSVTNPIVGKVLSGLLQRPGYMGVATPATNPGTPDGGAFYLAGEAGTYPNFGGVTVNHGVLTVITYSGTSWEAQNIDIASTLGSPEDEPAADGSAFSRILKNSDDIKTLQDMSSVVYNAGLITSLSVGSSVETAFVINGEYRLPVSGDTMVSATKTGVVVSSYAISTKGIFVYQIGAEITTVSFNKQTKLVTAISVSNIGTPEDSADKEGTIYGRIKALQEYGSGDKILEWDTDAATTRKKVPLAERKDGLQISYKPTGSTDWVNEQYNGTSFTDTNWAKDENWERVIMETDLQEVKKVLELNGIQNPIIVAESSSEEKKYINIDGTILSTSSTTELKTYTIDSAKKYMVLGSVSEIVNSFPMVGFYDSEGTVISVAYLPNNLKEGSFQLDIPQDTVTVKVVGYVGRQLPFLYEIADDLSLTIGRQAKSIAENNVKLIDIINDSIGNNLTDVKIGRISIYGYYNSPTPTLNPYWFTSRLFIPIGNVVSVKDKNGSDVKFRIYSFDKNKTWLRTTTVTSAVLQDDTKYVAFATTSGASSQVTQMTEEDFLLCSVTGVMATEDLTNRLSELEEKSKEYLSKTDINAVNASVGNESSPVALGTPYANGYYNTSTGFIENSKWMLSNFFAFVNDEVVTISLDGVDNLSMRIGTFDKDFNVQRWLSDAKLNSVTRQKGEVFCCFATVKESGYANLTVMTEEQFKSVVVGNALRTSNILPQIESIKKELAVPALETVNEHLLYPLIPRGGIYIPDNGTICLLGASFAVSDNGWFELACDKMSVTPMNKAIGAKSICDDANRYHDGTLWTDEEFDQFDVLVLMHVHNRNVFNSTEMKENIDDYVFPMKTIGQYYAPAFDYVIRKYIADCYACREKQSSKYYGSLVGKPCQIVLCTHWHDARTIYNSNVRRLAAKWNIPLITFDENIGWSRFNPLYDNGEEGGFQTSRIHTGDPTGEQGGYIETIDGVKYGWHPINGQDKYIQNKMASIFVSQMK